MADEDNEASRVDRTIVSPEPPTSQVDMEAVGQVDAATAAAGAKGRTIMMTPVPLGFGDGELPPSNPTPSSVTLDKTRTNMPANGGTRPRISTEAEAPPVAPRPQAAGWTPQPVRPTPPAPEQPLPSTVETSRDLFTTGQPAAAVLEEQPELFADRYLVEDTLGEGGMGQVCRVTCQRLGKQFALKRMLSTIAHNQELRATFYQEARLASSLTHPNIVSIVDYGEDEKHGAFMVMEIAQGESLSKRLEKGALPLRTMTDVILQIADALKHIHSKGIVHGDIKPDNILLHRANHSDSRRWQVMLLDFGLASLRSNDDAKSATVSGTPQYMAPERIQGAASTPSHDIYALGILAYQLTTGRLPFEGEMMEILKAHLHQEPPPFKAFLSTEVDPHLEALIFKAIAKDPADRHTNMAAFIYELRTLVDMLGLGRKRGGFKKVITSVSTVSDLAKDKHVAVAASGFNAAPVPLAVVSAEGVIEAANPAFIRFLGKDANDRVRGENVANERFTSAVPSLLKEIRRTLTTREKTTLAVQIPQKDYVSHLRISLTVAEGNTVLITVQIDSSQ